LSLVDFGSPQAQSYFIWGLILSLSKGLVLSLSKGLVLSLPKDCVPEIGKNAPKTGVYKWEAIALN